jgi:hypothetical protein
MIAVQDTAEKLSATVWTSMTKSITHPFRSLNHSSAFGICTGFNFLKDSWGIEFLAGWCRDSGLKPGCGPESRASEYRRKS